jgi:hypothetical protein
MSSSIRDLGEQMPIYFSTGTTTPRWAWTEGLHQFGQQEIAVRLAWPEQDPRDQGIRFLLNFLGNSIAEQPKRILGGQTLRYGLTMLRFVADERNESGLGTDRLLVEELRDPFHAHEPIYVPGASRAIAFVALQAAAFRRNGFTGDSQFPDRSPFAIVCSHVIPETIATLRPLLAHRTWEPDQEDSGWFIGCNEDDHEHDDPEQLGKVHLHHLVAGFPGLLAYLALLVETLLVFEHEHVTIFRQDEEHGQVDAVPLLQELPA